MRRAVAATVLGLCLLGVASAERPLSRAPAPLAIHSTFDAKGIVAAATFRDAGAIGSLTWGGVEFIDAFDHGRELQSAISFDGLTECDNPTEAGSRRDGTKAVSSSLLKEFSTTGNVLRTFTQMAYWLHPGEHSAACGAARNQAPSTLSDVSLSKTVRFLPNQPNVLEHQLVFHLPATRATAQFEVLTAYMPQRFDTFYTVDAQTGRVLPLSDGPGEQDLPVVLATRDGKHALGLYSPSPVIEKVSGPGYGRWRFQRDRVVKSNVVYRLDNAAAGSYGFTVYTVIGGLPDVHAALQRLQRRQ